MIHWIYVLLALSANLSVSSIDNLEKYRTTYFSEPSVDQLRSVIDELASLEHASAIPKAYHGCFMARIAGFGYNPYTKWSQFNQGRALIEVAVAEAPNEPEIRFLRLSVQHAAPSFLGYTDNVDDDLEFLLDALTRGWQTDNGSLQKQVILYLEDNDLVSVQQSRQLQLAQQRS